MGSSPTNWSRTSSRTSSTPTCSRTTSSCSTACSSRSARLSGAHRRCSAGSASCSLARLCGPVRGGVPRLGITSQSVPTILITDSVRGLGIAVRLCLPHLDNRAVRRRTGRPRAVGPGSCSPRPARDRHRGGGRGHPAIGAVRHVRLSLVLVVAGAAIATPGPRERTAPAADRREHQHRGRAAGGRRSLWRYPRSGGLGGALIIPGPSTVLRRAAAVPQDDDVPADPRSLKTADLVFVAITFGADVRDEPRYGADRLPVRRAEDGDLRRRRRVCGHDAAGLLRAADRARQLPAAGDRRRCTASPSLATSRCRP